MTHEEAASSGTATELVTEYRVLPSERGVKGYEAAVSIRLDLELTLSTLNAADYLSAEEPTVAAPADARLSYQMVRRSLWVAALVSYASCFSTRPGGLQRADVQKLDEGILPGAVDAHDLFMAMRNRHFAHRDSTLRKVVVSARPRAVDADPPNVYDMKTDWVDFVMPARDDWSVLARLVTALLERQVERVAAAHDSAAQVAATLSWEQWTTLPLAQVVADDVREATRWDCCTSR